MPALLLTVEMDNFSLGAFALKIAAACAIAVSLALVANRLSEGSWLPARWRR